MRRTLTLTYWKCCHVRMDAECDPSPYYASDCAKRADSVTVAEKITNINRDARVLFHLTDDSRRTQALTEYT